MKIADFSQVIFDFDLTLAKLVVDWSEWYIGVEKVGKQFDPTFGDHSKVTYEMMNELIQNYGSAAKLAILTFWQKYEKDNVSGMIPIETTLTLLRQLQPHQQAHLLSSNTRPTVMPLLAELKIEQLFKTIVMQEDVKFFKPDPYALSLIKNAATPLSEYVMIGDSKNDEGFARNAGISFIHVDNLS